MIYFEIKSRVQNLGKRSGQTVYYAQPKSQQHLTTSMLVERIVRETSLSAGDVHNALVSLANVVCDSLTLGMSVDLGELGSLRPVIPSKMMNTREEVTVANALKTPRVRFTPKSTMRAAVNSIKMTIVRDKEADPELPTPLPDDDLPIEVK